jgi:ribosome biogenesis GTPase
MLHDEVDEEKVPHHQRFGDRSKNSQHRKMERTGALRAAEGAVADDIQSLPIGEVLQVYSLFCQVGHPSGKRLCVVRKTLAKLSETAIVVGDLVRFRDGKVEMPSSSTSIPGVNEPDAVIEQVLPRRTVLTRANSFNKDRQHPIVANAEQMLIVASLVSPEVKWGLVDRMIIAAKSGGLEPIVCLNKIDLPGKLPAAQEVLKHYASLGIRCCEAAVVGRVGLDTLAEMLKGKMTVLAGHSGVGKSSLIAAIQLGLDIRIGEVSHYTDKGRHTTTSARRYDLAMGGCVVDTPGVKMFGLWNVTRENLREYYPDVEAGNAPEWRKESFERISESLAG